MGTIGAGASLKQIRDELVALRGYHGISQQRVLVFGKGLMRLPAVLDEMTHLNHLDRSVATYRVVVHAVPRVRIERWRKALEGTLNLDGKSGLSLKERRTSIRAAEFYSDKEYRTLEEEAYIELASTLIQLTVSPCRVHDQTADSDVSFSRYFSPEDERRFEEEEAHFEAMLDEAREFPAPIDVVLDSLNDYVAALSSGAAKVVDDPLIGLLVPSNKDAQARIPLSEVIEQLPLYRNAPELSSLRGLDPQELPNVFLRGIADLRSGVALDDPAEFESVIELIAEIASS